MNRTIQPIALADLGDMQRQCTHSPKKALSLCHSCYQRYLYHRRRPATCHPDRRVHAGGYCRPCYRSGKRGARPTCHPDRVHAAQGLCTDCYNALPQTRARNRDAKRRRKYGITAEQFAGMLAAQDGLCAICRRDEPTGVDHDHSTGAIRGLLCVRCNAGIGFFGDDIGVMARAIAYVRCGGTVGHCGGPQ